MPKVMNIMLITVGCTLQAYIHATNDSVFSIHNLSLQLSNEVQSLCHGISMYLNLVHLLLDYRIMLRRITVSRGRKEF